MPATAVPYTKTNDSKRYEGKLTGSLRQGHTLQGSFIDNRVHRGNEPVLSFSIDRAALISPSVPNRLGVVNYNAALTPAHAAVGAVLAEGLGDGGRRRHVDQHPRFAVPDAHGHAVSVQRAVLRRERPEQRNNRQLTASVTYFASSRRFGSHELKGGFENFVDTRVGANAQSSTGYVFLADFRWSRRRAGAGRRRPSDSAVRAGHVARAALDSASRRRVQPDDDVGVRAGSLDRRRRS